ncbi:hypothetical protein [Pseudoduganella sp. OTU4001]|uniref:hypothetical protein n=1 Tax=Pseudoduganella sp. OTU4001 TaxID=3043854 RepID=UPI00313CBA5C
MDYEERVVKLEVNMDAQKEELTLLQRQVARLDEKADEFREHAYRKMDELRDRIDGTRDAMINRIDASRDHTDRRFDEMHTEMVQLRRDHERLIYWVAGFTIANLVATTGWILKAAGVF